MNAAASFESRGSRRSVTREPDGRTTIACGRSVVRRSRCLRRGSPGARRPGRSHIPSGPSRRQTRARGCCCVRQPGMRSRKVLKTPTAGCAPAGGSNLAAAPTAWDAGRPSLAAGAIEAPREPR
eukprot:3210264-Prymnesium_polylepis.1